ncbi:hypothetical protein RRF57_007626 [Xylaria bambusicola]|uniref:Cytoplasmic tRNA 2-thiolation protein 2 n=1 Tax=Xylaria bambusicola TaxID=326684 RepID=A0AAN7Z7N6_9PEZI
MSTIKRLEVLQRETRGAKLSSRPQRYLLALSRGPSSTALLHILNENVRRQREKSGRVKFELVVVFVDIDVGFDQSEERKTATESPESDVASPAPTNGTATRAGTGTAPPSSESADTFTAHFPELTIHTVLLSSILSSPAIDWSLLPSQNTSLPPSQRLADFFARLPSASARADVSRLLIRHALYAAAIARDCAVILLGYTTTALAELTLSEAAKGRGFGIPWFVNDGTFPLPRAVDLDQEAASIAEVSRDLASTGLSDDDDASAGRAPLVYTSTAPCLPSRSASSALPLLINTPEPRYRRAQWRAVVSHRDLSLDDVVTRFFADAEASYPSVVANVVRTTGKLNRLTPIVATQQTDADAQIAGRQCRLCGVGLDPLGDERWKGEIGEADVITSNIVSDDGRTVGAERRGRLCYGCERSVRG